MSTTTIQALAKPWIETVSQNHKKRIFKVRMGTIRKVITVRVLSQGGGYVTTQDYAIKAGSQGRPYKVRCRTYASPGEALEEALSTYCFYYKLAVRHGYEPKSSWLVPLT